MSCSAKPFVSRLHEAPAFWAPAARSTVLATGVQTNNVFTLIHSIYYDKGFAIKARTNAQDGGIYVLKGAVDMSAGGSRYQAMPGHFIGIPKLTEYSYTIEAADTEMLFFYTPAGPEQILMGGAQPAIKAGPPPPELPGIPPQRIKTLSAQYGLQWVGGTETKPAKGSTQVPFHSSNETAPAYWVQPVIPELWIQLATGQQTNNAYSFTESLFSQGNAAAPLSYGSRDELYYILDGTATFLLGDHTMEAAQDDFVFIPRGTVFGLRIDSESWRAVGWHTPSGIIEGTLPLMLTGGLEAGKHRSLPPPERLSRPQVDPTTFVAQARALDINLLAVEDPLKQ